MTTSFTENVRQRFAGDLSEGEKLVCSNFRDLLHAALKGQISFKDATSSLWSALSALREFGYDVDTAISSGTFDPLMQRSTTQISPAPLSVPEKAFIEDADGLIDWATRNGVNFSVVLLTLGHDLSELSNDGFHLEKALGPGRRILPKVTGWASRNTEPLGEADDQT